MSKPETTTNNEQTPFKILHEDNHIIVVLKPRNMPSQEDKTGDTDLLTAVKEYIKVKYEKKGEAFVGLVHRLDRPTGGVMVFAKTSKAAARLSEQIKEGKVGKKYFAITAGIPKERFGKIETYLVKDERNNIVKNHIAKVANSKLAILEYRVLELADEEGLGLMDIDLITGRSHQARVQLAYLGNPIFGDHKYGGTKSVGKGHTLALWAYSLTFTHPTTNELHTFRSFPPEDEHPWNLFSFDKYVSVASQRQ